MSRNANSQFLWTHIGEIGPIFNFCIYTMMMQTSNPQTKLLSKIVQEIQLGLFFNGLVFVWVFSSKTWQSWRQATTLRVLELATIVHVDIV